MNYNDDAYEVIHDKTVNDKLLTDFRKQALQDEITNTAVLGQQRVMRDVPLVESWKSPLRVLMGLTLWHRGVE